MHRAQAGREAIKPATGMEDLLGGRLDRRLLDEAVSLGIDTQGKTLGQVYGDVAAHYAALDAAAERHVNLVNDEALVGTRNDQRNQDAGLVNERSGNYDNIKRISEGQPTGGDDAAAVRGSASETPVKRDAVPRPADAREVGQGRDFKDAPSNRREQSRLAAETETHDLANFDGSKQFDTEQNAKAFIDQHRLEANAVKSADGHWIIEPVHHEPTAQEKASAQTDIDRLNDAIDAAGESGGESGSRLRPLTRPPSRAMRAAQFIARMFGVSLRFIEHNSRYEGVALGTKAFISPSLRNPETALAGHEIFHVLERVAPKTAEQFRRYVSAFLHLGAVDARRRYEDANGGKNTSMKKAESEVLADINGAMWADPKFWREMRRIDPDLWRRVGYMFMENMNRAIKVLKGGHFDVSRMVSDVDAVRKIIAQLSVKHIADISRLAGDMQGSAGNELLLSRAYRERDLLPGDVTLKEQVRAAWRRQPEKLDGMSRSINSETVNRSNAEQGQDKNPGPVSFSRLEKTIDDEMPRNKLGEVAPQRALDWLDAEAEKGHLFNSEELNGSGVREWLAIQEHPLTVEDINAFIERNRTPASDHGKNLFSGDIVADGVIPRDPEFDTGVPFKTLSSANLFKRKHGIADGVMPIGENGKDGFVFYPAEKKYSKEEKNKILDFIESLNARRARDGLSLIEAFPIFNSKNLGLRLAQFIGKIFGAEVIVVKKNNQFEGVSIGRKIFLSEKMQSPVTAIIGHEISHFLENVNPAAHQKLKDFIWKYLQDGYIEKRRKWDNDRRHENDPEMGFTGAHNEVIADLTGAMWLDPLFWREMIRRDENMFRQVAYVFMEVSTKVAAAVKGTNFDVHSIVKDVETTRRILAAVWSEHLQGNDRRLERGREEPSSTSGNDAAQNNREENEGISFSRKADAERYKKERGLDHDVVEDGRGRFMLALKGAAPDSTTGREKINASGGGDSLPEAAERPNSRPVPQDVEPGSKAERRDIEPDPPDDVNISQKGQIDSAPFFLMADSVHAYLPRDENGMISPQQAIVWLCARSDGPSHLSVETLYRSGALDWLLQQNGPIPLEDLVRYIRGVGTQLSRNGAVQAPGMHTTNEWGSASGARPPTEQAHKGTSPAGLFDVLQGSDAPPHKLVAHTDGENTAIYVLDANGNKVRVFGVLTEYFKNVRRSWAEKTRRVKFKSKKGTMPGIVSPIGSCATRVILICLRRMGISICPLSELWKMIFHVTLIREIG